MWRHTETQAMAGVVWRGQAKQLDWKHRTVWPLLGKRKMAGHTYIWVGQLFIHCHNLPDPVTKDRHNTDVGEAMERSLSVDECWLRSGVCCIGSSSPRLPLGKRDSFYCCSVLYYSDASFWEGSSTVQGWWLAVFPCDFVSPRRLRVGWVRRSLGHWPPLTRRCGLDGVEESGSTTRYTL